MNLKNKNVFEVFRDIQLNGVVWMVLPKCPHCGARHYFLTDGSNLARNIREELAPCNPKRTIKIQYQGHEYEGRGVVMKPVEFWRR